MSKNTNIAELINYISVDGSGNIVFTTVSAATTNTDKFLVSDAGVLKFRTAAQLLSDIGAQASGSYQAALSGTGFVKISGTTISYDNSTYATQTYVGTAISNLVDSSPATLDTLNELAAALGDDPNFATTVATSIGTKQPQLNGTGFVKVTGTTVSYDNSTYALDSAVVHLAGNESITGVKTFTGAGNTFTQNTNFLDRIYLRSASTADYTNLSGHTNQLLVGVIGATHILSFPQNTNYTYTFPAVSGTLALTSNLSSYLPLAGGTLTGALNIRYNGGTSVDAVIRLRGTNATARTTRLQFEDYNGTIADGIIEFKIPTAGTASSATLSMGVNGAGLTFDINNTATFSSTVAVGGEITTASSATFGAANSTANVRIYSNGSPLTIFGGTGYARGFLGFTWDINPDRGIIIGNELRFNTNAIAGSTIGSTSLKITSTGASTFTSTSGGKIIRIDGPSNTDNYLSIHAGGIEMFIDADNTNSAGITGTQSNHPLYLRTNGSDKVFIKTDGNVGIGTNNPTNRLQVSGNIYSTDTVFARNLKPEAFAGPVAGTPTGATIPLGYSSMNISMTSDNVWRPIMNNINDVKGYFWVTLGDAASKDTAQYFMAMTSPPYGVYNFGQISYQDNGWNTGNFEFSYDNSGSSGGTHRLLVRFQSYYNSANTAYGTIYFLRLE